MKTSEVVFPIRLGHSGRHGHRHVSRQVHRAHDDAGQHSDEVIDRGRDIHCGERRHLDRHRHGQATPTTTPGVLSIVEVYTITGGTGRFADATGTFAREIIVTQATGVSTGTFSGGVTSTTKAHASLMPRHPCAGEAGGLN